MSDGTTRNAAPVSNLSSAQLGGALATALVLEASAAAAAESAPSAPDSPERARSADGVGPRRVVHINRSSRRRRPARLVRTHVSPDISRATIPGSSGDALSQPDTRSELRDWIKENATLLSNASLLISIAALALSVLPSTGFLDPYIKALIFGAALLLLVELHHQWPDDLQLHAFRKAALPRTHSWRMSSFAILMQIATVLFAVWATLTNPIILLPLTALAVVIAFRTWYFRHFSGIVARVFGIVALVAVLLISEVLMVIVWAAISGQQVTLEFFTDRGTTFEISE